MSESTPSPILRYFAADHLPDGPLRDTSRHFAVLARILDSELPNGAEKSTALRKLLEAKDAAVRSALDRYCRCSPELAQLGHGIDCPQWSMTGTVTR